VRLFRITQQREAAAAFDGVGSSLFPGRWNVRSQRVVYVTSHVALGILEVMVQSSGAPLHDYVAFPIDVPDSAVETFDRSLLSATWRTAITGRAECREHGERWRAGGSSVGLIVPSAVLPEAYEFGEFNVLLNPVHAGIARANAGNAIPLEIDERLRALAAPPT
jgi:RES domain-containing protein